MSLAFWRQLITIHLEIWPICRAVSSGLECLWWKNSENIAFFVFPMILIIKNPRQNSPRIPGYFSVKQTSNYPKKLSFFFFFFSFLEINYKIVFFFFFYFSCSPELLTLWGLISPGLWKVTFALSFSSNGKNFILPRFSCILTMK